MENFTASNVSLETLFKSITDLKNEVKKFEEEVDIFFTLMMAIIIFFMQCGFAFLEAGAVRSKNTTNILMKNTIDAFVACCVYWAVGFAFAFGEGNIFIGWTQFFGQFNNHSVRSIVKEEANWLSHYVYAANTVTIVSGALAERTQFFFYGVFTCFASGIVYPCVTRWVWYTTCEDTGGSACDNPWGSAFTWMNATSGGTVVYHDYAGGTAVHYLGGIMGLVGTVILGPRRGRFKKDGTVNPMPGHSISLTALGMFVLMFGFLAFNGGANFIIHTNTEIALRAVINTLVSGSAAAVTAISVHYLTAGCRLGRYLKQRLARGAPWSLSTLINGALVGMVSVCFGGDMMPIWGAFLTGCISAFFYTGIATVMLRLRIDDPLNAVAVHVGGGFWGAVAATLFHKKYGIIAGEDGQRSIGGMRLGVNLLGLLIISVWGIVLCTMFFKFMNYFNFMRVDTELEYKGLDMGVHGESAYPTAAYGDGWGDFLLGQTELAKTVVAIWALLATKKLKINDKLQTTLDGCENGDNPLESNDVDLDDEDETPEQQLARMTLIVSEQIFNQELAPYEIPPAVMRRPRVLSHHLLDNHDDVGQRQRKVASFPFLNRASSRNARTAIGDFEAAPKFPVEGEDQKSSIKPTMKPRKSLSWKRMRRPKKAVEPTVSFPLSNSDDSGVIEERRLSVATSTAESTTLSGGASAMSNYGSAV